MNYQENNKYLKKKLKGLTDDEKRRKIKALAFEELLEEWRGNVLKLYREEHPERCRELKP